MIASVNLPCNSHYSNHMHGKAFGQKILLPLHASSRGMCNTEQKKQGIINDGSFGFKALDPYLVAARITNHENNQFIQQTVESSRVACHVLDKVSTSLLAGTV